MNLLSNFPTLGIVVALAGSPGCSAQPGAAGEAVTQPGSLRLALVTETNGVTYRLQATFAVSGPEQYILSSSSEDATLSQELIPGLYVVVIQQEFTLFRQNDGQAPVPIPAELISPQIQSVQIQSGEASVLTYRFSTPDGEIDFEPGSLQITFEVEPTGAGCSAPASPDVGAFDLAVPADFATIQEALNAAADGDTIRVSAGVYTENIDFGGKAVRLVSESGPVATVIDGGLAGPVVNMSSGETSLSVLEGFTVRHGSANFGAGVSLLLASPTIRGNIFEDNLQSSGGFGAAIGGNNASPLIEANIFRRNACDSQFLSGVVAIVNGSSPRVINNVFVDNPCRGVNFTLPEGPTPEVSNNTFIGNDVGIHVDTRVPARAQLYRNNIIISGPVGVEFVFGDASTAPVWSHNLVFGNVQDFVGLEDPTGLDGNLSVDPQLTDAAAGDFHLLPGSPAIDSGDAALAPLSEHDFDGDARSAGVTVDIGADELSGCRRALR